MTRSGQAFAAALMACALAGCQAGSAGLSHPVAYSALVGQKVAFETFEGPPAEARPALEEALASAAAARKVEIAGRDESARYRIKGYLTAETAPDGATTLAFVWDVFDAGKRRMRRISGSSPATAAARDWHELDNAALRRLAERSMEEIAVFLAGSTVGAAEPPA